MNLSPVGSTNFILCSTHLCNFSIIQDPPFISYVSGPNGQTNRQAPFCYEPSYIYEKY